MYTDTALALCAEQRNASLQQQQLTQGGLPLAVPAVLLRLQPRHSSVCPAHVKHITAYVPLHNHMAALPPSKLSGSTSLSEVVFMAGKCFGYLFLRYFLPLYFTSLSLAFPVLSSFNIPYPLCVFFTITFPDSVMFVKTGLQAYTE